VKGAAKYPPGRQASAKAAGGLANAGPLSSWGGWSAIEEQGRFLPPALPLSLRPLLPEDGNPSDFAGTGFSLSGWLKRD
jgi:hypothetical protein